MMVQRERGTALHNTTQEANLLDAALIACQEGVKKNHTKTTAGKKRRLQSMQFHLPVRTFSHLQIFLLPISGERERGDRSSEPQQNMPKFDPNTWQETLGPADVIRAGWLNEAPGGEGCEVR